MVTPKETDMPTRFLNLDRDMNVSGSLHEAFISRMFFQVS